MYICYYFCKCILCCRHTLNHGPLRISTGLDAVQQNAHAGSEYIIAYPQIPDVNETLPLLYIVSNTHTLWISQHMVML